MDWLIKACLSEVPTNHRAWRIIDRTDTPEGLQVRGAVCEPQFTGEGELFSEELQGKPLQLGPRGWCQALVALLIPLVEQDLYKTGKALADRGGLGQLRVCKPREHPEGEERSMKQRTRFAWVTLKTDVERRVWSWDS